MTIDIHKMITGNPITKNNSFALCFRLSSVARKLDQR